MGVKWVAGVVGVSTVVAALIVTSISSTTAEAPVLTDGAHFVNASNEQEKAPATKPEKSKKNPSANKNSENKPAVVVYQPSQQSTVYPTNSNSESAQTPKYGKNAAAKTKVTSKAKKPSVEQNMTEGEPPAGVPIEGPINHVE